MPLKYFDEKKKKANKWDTIVTNAVWTRESNLMSSETKTADQKMFKKRAQLRICIFLYDFRERNP